MDVSPSTSRRGWRWSCILSVAFSGVKVSWTIRLGTDVPFQRGIPPWLLTQPHLLIVAPWPRASPGRCPPSPPPRRPLAARLRRLAASLGARRRQSSRWPSVLCVPHITNNAADVVQACEVGSETPVNAPRLTRLTDVTMRASCITASPTGSDAGIGLRPAARGIGCQAPVRPMATRPCGPSPVHGRVASACAPSGASAPSFATVDVPRRCARPGPRGRAARLPVGGPRG